MKKAILFIALALTGLSANIANAQTTIASGNCGASGNNLTWVLTDDSVLTISGSGAMADYDIPVNDSPWASNRNKIKTLVIGNSVTTIGDFAFYECRGLTGTLTIPNSVMTIGNSAFYYCYGLTSVTIGNSVTTIGEGAFVACSGLSGALTIPNSVTTIGSAAFLNCIGLTSINVDANNPNYSSNDGILYDKAQDTLIQCPAGKTGALTIPNSVTTIGTAAFYRCSRLTSVIIPNSVTTIGSVAFSDCSGLTGALTIPNSVTTIGSIAFYDCYGLTSVTIGNSVTTIDERAFHNCSGLSGALTIPNSVTFIGNSAFAECSGLNGVLTIGNSITTIGNWAFSNCSGLTEITSLAINPPAIFADTFFDVPKTIPVHVPCGSENAYQATDGWREFTNYTDCIGGNGLTDVEAANFNIYPNPANDRINFSCSEAIKEIEVFNIVGQQVYVAKVNEKFTALNVAGFAKGSYIAKLHTAKGVVAKKFVVE